MIDETIFAPRPPSSPDHDHAWRRTKGADAKTLIDGAYRCDVCGATWSM